MKGMAGIKGMDIGGQSIGCQLNNVKSDHLRTMQVFTGSACSGRYQQQYQFAGGSLRATRPECPETPVNHG
jgi:hypothetical protein